MLRSLFQAIEQSLGPSLATVAAIVYWAAIALLVHRIVAPIFRLRMEMVAARLKVMESIMMECPYCHRETIVHDSQCSFCRKSIGLPWSLRAWHFIRLRRHPKWFRWTCWTWDILGLVLFIAITLIGLFAIKPWELSGPLQQLFIGIAILCWVGLGWTAARILDISTHGPIARLRDLVFSMAITGVLAVSLFLAIESRPVEEAVMWRIPVGEGAIARIDGKPLTLPQGMIGFEYLQVDHELIGYHRVIPMAFLGSERMNLGHKGLEKWFLDNLWKRGQGYSERGLSVRSRVEQFIVTPNQTYEVVERDKQVFFRPAAQQ
ncbi:MAG TPA: hypothetical protein VHB46_03010 [Burkholderiales bacterium]|nr:hypothetical protein [Burkholderiales bacterium]